MNEPVKIIWPNCFCQTNKKEKYLLNLPVVISPSRGHILSGSCRCGMMPAPSCRLVVRIHSDGTRIAAHDARGLMVYRELRVRSRRRWTSGQRWRGISRSRRIRRTVVIARGSCRVPCSHCTLLRPRQCRMTLKKKKKNMKFST